MQICYTISELFLVDSCVTFNAREGSVQEIVCFFLLNSASRPSGVLEEHISLKRNVIFARISLAVSELLNISVKFCCILWNNNRDTSPFFFPFLSFPFRNNHHGICIFRRNHSPRVYWFINGISVRFRLFRDLFFKKERKKNLAEICEHQLAIIEEARISFINN